MDAAAGPAQSRNPVPGCPRQDLAERRPDQSPPLAESRGAAMTQTELAQVRNTILPGENFMRRLTIFAALMLAVLLACLPALAQDIITTAIGGGPSGIPAIDANLYNPYGVAVDAAGNFYI